MTHALPQPGYGRRMTCYLQEMYPLPLRAPLSLIIGATAVLFTTHVQGGATTDLLGPIAVTCAAAFLILLLLRLMDELKDLEIDLQLFRDRPLPSGRVREHDIRWSMAAVTAAYVGVHLLYPASLLSALPLLGYTYLMYRYFFIPGVMRDNLFLNLATHNPVIPLIFLHLVLVTAAAGGVAPSALHWPLLLRGVGMLWMTMFAWEIARKIRGPREENDYVTYSRLLGRGGAVALAFTAQTISAVCALVFAGEGRWMLLALTPMLGGYGLQCFAYVRFLRRPDARTARLRPFAELYAVLLMISVILASWSAL